jgi:serine/threonine protein kinase
MVNNFSIKLIDFGSVRKLNKNEMCSTKIGTSHYMSPEIIKGEQYDYKCDLWSLGVLMYYLLYGTKPFQGETNDELFANIIKGDVNVNSNNISISNECKQLLMRLLEVDPYKRININDALHSEWILQCNSNNNINGFILEHNELIILIKNNIETISVQNKIQLAFLSYVINFDSVLDKNIYYQLFNYFDRDGDGLLNKNELLNGLTILYENNINKSQLICDKLFAIFTDINNTNSFINIDQFLIVCINRKDLITNKHIQNTFMCLDKYKQGKLTYDVIKTFLIKNTQQIVNDVIVDDIWKGCDMELKESEMVYAKFSQMIKGIM